MSAYLPTKGNITDDDIDLARNLKLVDLNKWLEHLGHENATTKSNAVKVLENEQREQTATSPVEGTTGEGTTSVDEAIAEALAIEVEPFTLKTMDTDEVAALYAHINSHARAEDQAISVEEAVDYFMTCYDGNHVTTEFQVRMSLAQEGFWDSEPPNDHEAAIKLVLDGIEAKVRANMDDAAQDGGTDTVMVDDVKPNDPDAPVRLTKLTLACLLAVAATEEKQVAAYTKSVESNPEFSRLADPETGEPFHGDEWAWDEVHPWIDLATVKHNMEGRFSGSFYKCVEPGTLEKRESKELLASGGEALVVWVRFTKRGLASIASAEKSGKKPAEPKVSKPRTKQPDRVIEVNPKLGGRNPRREGTHGFHSFKQYTPGITYSQYLRNGGGSNHADWDRKHGFIRFMDEDFAPLKLPETPEERAAKTKATADAKAADKALVKAQAEANQREADKQAAKDAKANKAK